MSNSKAVERHRAELVGRVSPIYEVLAAVEGAESGKGPSDELRREAAALAEFVVETDPKSGAGAGPSAETIVRVDPGGAARAFARWRTAAEEATISRAAFRAVLRDFGRWVEATAKPTPRPALLEALPGLAALAGRSRPDAILSLVRTAAALEPEGAGVAMLKAAAGAGARKAAWVAEVTSRFPSWRESADPSLREAFDEAIAGLGPVLPDLGEGGVDEVLSAFAAGEATEDTAKALASLAPYGETTAEAVLALARIGKTALARGEPRVLGRLLDALPADRLFDSPRGAKLLGSVAALSAACESEEGETWIDAMDLVIALAEESWGSAQYVAGRLPAILGGLPGNARAAYAKDFSILIGSIGTRVAGFGTGSLPGMYDRHGTKLVRKFVRTAAEVGDACGTTAGQWFVERKTAAAREALKG